MAETSDVFLVRGSLQLLGTETMITTSLLFFVAAGGSTSWTADQDYNVLRCVSVSSSAQCVLATDATTYTSLFSAAGNLRLGTVLHIGNSPVTEQNFPIRKNQKLFFTNNSATNGSILVILGTP